MTTGVRKGLLLAAIHVAIVSSLGAKLLIDRATRPRVWARVAPYDPSVPIRGRYVSLRVEGTLAGVPSADTEEVTLSVVNDSLVFVPAAGTTGLVANTSRRQGGAVVATLAEPIAFFIPEHLADPSNRPPGEELWAEVTLPRRGGPRPIRLGIKKDGRLTPLR